MALRLEITTVAVDIRYLLLYRKWIQHQYIMSDT